MVERSEPHMLNPRFYREEEKFILGAKKVRATGWRLQSAITFFFYEYPREKPGHRVKNFYSQSMLAMRRRTQMTRRHFSPP